MTSGFHHSASTTASSTTQSTATASAIREGLRKLAPPGVQIRHGRTSSRFEVESSYEQGESGCSLSGLQVSVDITVSLPEWRPTPRAPAALHGQWSAAIRQLTRHEAGHRMHAVEAAQELREALLRLPAEADCMRMQLRVDEAVRSAKWKLGRRDRFYDRRTEGGLRDDPQAP